MEIKCHDKERVARFEAILKRLQDAVKLFPVGSSEYEDIDTYLTEWGLALNDWFEDDWEGEVLRWLEKNIGKRTQHP
eukprot:11488-Eustigmatos_ZCMA.PRE.1